MTCQNRITNASSTGPPIQCKGDCGKTLPRDNFYKQCSTKTGYMSMCIPCYKIYRKTKHIRALRQPVNGKLLCVSCKTHKNMDQFSPTTPSATGKPRWSSYCHSCQVSKFKVSRKESNKKWYSANKSIISRRVAKKERSELGKLSRLYRQQFASSSDRGHSPPTYTFQELFEFAYDHGYVNIHDRWEQSGYKNELSPSIDRLDNSIGYTLDNIRLVTWKENYKASRKTNSIDALQFDKSGKFIDLFPSITQAAREQHLNISNIAHACNNKSSVKYCGGYRWVRNKPPFNKKENNLCAVFL